MIYAKTISMLAALALACQAVAEPLGKNRLFMSTRDLFGLESRGDSSYNPKAAVCGMGSDCSSCGSGYQRCSSNDQYIHCYDQSSNATCCSDGSGNSCDTGYYCYPGTLSKTLCCPDGVDKDTCKSLYGATLTSILPTSTATPSSTATGTTVSTSSVASTVSTTSSSSSEASPSSTSVMVYDASSTSAPLSNNATNATATYSKSSATASLTGSSSSSTGTSTSGAVHNAASFLALFGAVVVAAVL